jgi:CHASE3 domain sensor protein
MDTRKIWKLRHWIMFGYAVPVVALIISAGVTVVNVRQLKAISAELERAWNVRDNVTDLDGKIQSISRSTRGYMLDGNETSLKNFDETKSAYNRDFSQPGRDRY